MKHRGNKTFYETFAHAAEKDLFWWVLICLRHTTSPAGQYGAATNNLIEYGGVQALEQLPVSVSVPVSVRKRESAPLSPPNRPPHEHLEISLGVRRL